MRLLYDPNSTFVEIEGTCNEFFELARQIGEGIENPSCDINEEHDTDNAYPVSLTEITLLRKSGEGARISVCEDRLLMITGDQQSLASLEEQLRAAAKMKSGSHMHLEYYDGHPWLEKDTYPTALAVLE